MFSMKVYFSSINFNWINLMNFKRKSILTTFYFLLLTYDVHVSSSSNFFVNKCLCKRNEALSNDKCISKSPLNIQIWNETAGKESIEDISVLQNVNVKPVICPSNFVKDISFDWVFISDNGLLLKPPFAPTSLYCIEYIITEENKVIPKLEMCLPKLNLPLCCGLLDYVNSKGQCTSIASEGIKNISLRILQNFNHVENPLSCENDKKEIKILSSTTSVSDLYSIFSHYIEAAANNFCIGMYGNESEISIGLTFCASIFRNESVKLRPKIPLCCPSDQAFNIESGCLSHEEKFIFPSHIEWPSNGANMIQSVMNCSLFSVLNLNESVMHFFSSNGTLHVDSDNHIPLNKYCLGAVIKDNSTLHSGLICLKSERFISCSWRWSVYLICLIISTLFLTATLIVYIGISELRRRVGGMCLISELLALLVSQIILIILQTHQENFSDVACFTTGVIEIIFILASFFWLNIICYDVWSTFRKLRPYSEKILNLKTFVKYSLYGWGVPFLIGVLAIILQQVNSPMKPGFSLENGCFFNEHSLPQHWFYLYGLILILLLINSCFFIHLTYKLRSSSADSKRTFQGSSNHNSSRREERDAINVKLYGKLFVIMGLPWLLEIFTSFASSDVLCYIWFLDLVNGLRGVLIFLIFVCKKSTRDMILKSWFPKKTSREDSSQPKSSTISLTSWLPPFHGRKTNKNSTLSVESTQRQ